MLMDVPACPDVASLIAQVQALTHTIEDMRSTIVALTKRVQQLEQARAFDTDRAAGPPPPLPPITSSP